jgi:hypothetical protein
MLGVSTTEVKPALGGYAFFAAKRDAFFCHRPLLTLTFLMRRSLSYRRGDVLE